MPPLDVAFTADECLALAERHGTPCFAYRKSEVLARYRELRAALPPRARIAYAVKANPHAELIATLAAAGASFDCASAGELDRVHAAGVAGDRMFFAGPGKRTAELARALELGARVQAEGLEDLEWLEELAPSPIAVNLRVHPRDPVMSQDRLLGGAGPSAFGVDEEDAGEVLSRARKLRHVQVRGLHVFAASNERDATRLLATHRMVFDLARRARHDHRVPIEQIDVGGGLGVPYGPEETPLDVTELGRGLAALLAESKWFTGELILEPGRFLVATCGVYLVRVVRVKRSRGVRFAILEAGINHLLRPQLTGGKFPVRAIGKSGPETSTTLAGPLCTALDRLGVAELPELAAGDLIAFDRVGAYGATEAMTKFLSHPEAMEIAVD